MTRTRYTFFIDPNLREALAAIKERDGMPESEQIRRALRAWVDVKASATGDRIRTAKRAKTTKGRRR